MSKEKNLMEMIKAAGLKKYYVTDNYEVHALDGVSLSVEEGEFLAIIGTSGSGKTTLLQILGGLDEPTAGGVWIRGNSLKDMTEDERTIFRRRNIGFVFQQYNLIPVINVYENIVLPLRLDGAEIDEKLLEDIVRTLKIGEKLENLPEEIKLADIFSSRISYGKIYTIKQVNEIIDKIHEEYGLRKIPATKIITYFNHELSSPKIDNHTTRCVKLNYRNKLNF